MLTLEKAATNGPDYYGPGLLRRDLRRRLQQAVHRLRFRRRCFLRFERHNRSDRFMPSESVLAQVQWDGEQVPMYSDVRWKDTRG